MIQPPKVLSKRTQQIMLKCQKDSEHIVKYAKNLFGNRAEYFEYSRFTRGDVLTLAEDDDDIDESLIDNNSVEVFSLIRIAYYSSHPDDDAVIRLEMNTFYMNEKSQWFMMNVNPTTEALGAPLTEDELLEKIASINDIETSSDHNIVLQPIFNKIPALYHDWYDKFIKKYNEYYKNYYPIVFETKQSIKMAEDLHGNKFGEFTRTDFEYLARLKYSNGEVSFHVITFEVAGTEYTLYPLNEFGVFALDYENQHVALHMQQMEILVNGIVKESLGKEALQKMSDNMYSQLYEKYDRIMDGLVTSERITFKYESYELSHYGKLCSFTQLLDTAYKDEKIILFNVLNIYNRDVASKHKQHTKVFFGGIDDQGKHIFRYMYWDEKTQTSKSEAFDNIDDLILFVRADMSIS